MSLAPVYQPVWKSESVRAASLPWIGWVQLVGWLMVASILTLHFGLPMQVPPLHSLLFAFMATLVLVMLTTAAGLSYQHCLRWPMLSQLATALLSSVIIALVAVMLVNLLVSHLVRSEGLSVAHNFSVFFLLAAGWSTLYFAAGHFCLRLHQHKLDSSIARQVHASQMRAMEQKLNPHFLFNTLNAISTQILKQDVTAARSTLQLLAEFLRRALEASDEKKSTLDEELTVVMMYLDIEKTRFASRLRVKVNVDKQVKGAQLPRMILLPLITRAVKTAVASTPKSGEISIQATRHNNLLQLQVADNSPDAEIDYAAVTGDATYTEQLTFRDTELQVVAQRLAALYPQQHIFRIEKNQPSGVRVVMMIPYEEP